MSEGADAQLIRTAFGRRRNLLRQQIVPPRGDFSLHMRYKMRAQNVQRQ